MSEWRPGYKPPEPNFEPISLTVFFATSLMQLGVGGYAAFQAAFAVTSFIVAAAPFAISAGLSYAATALTRTRNQRPPVSASQPEARLNTRQEVPAQRWVYGEVLIGGALFFERSRNPKYYQGFLLSQGPISEVLAVYNSQYWIPIQNMRFDAVLNPLTNIDGSPPYLDISTGTSRIAFSFRRGDDDQAIDPILAANFPDLSASTFRQRGVATMVVRSDFGGRPGLGGESDADRADRLTDAFENNELLWGSSRRPNPLALVRGVPVYDPRDPTQILPTDPTDPAELSAARATWRWTNNASLVIADYLWRREGGRVPLSQIDWEKIKESADWDDGLIGTKSGELIRRHTVDGVCTSGDQPAQVLQAMLTANRGTIVRSGGKVWVRSSQPTEPEITIVDEMLLGGIEFRRAAPKEALVNRLSCQFVDPRQAWTTVDGPVRDRTDWQVEDGTVYAASVSLTFTADHRRAQRLQKLFMEETRLGRQVTISTNLRCLGLDAGSVVRLQSETIPRASGLYKIEKLAFDDNFTALQLMLAEYDPSFELDWDPATDEQDFELPDLEVPVNEGG